MARRAKKRRRGREAQRKERCPVCKKELRHPVVGRHRRFCSNACRQVAYRRRKGEGQRRGLVRLVQADAREFLAGLPDESVDLVLTDPPYAFERGGSRFREWFPELPDEAWPQILRQLYRVLTFDRHAYLFCDRRAQGLFEATAQEAGFRVNPPLVWDKRSHGLGGAWRSQYELILFLEKGHRLGNFKNRGNVLQASRVARGYPTEKPVGVLKQLIAQSSERGELVLDPFCGSGSTGMAARGLGRRAVLCDVNAEVAAGRLRLGIDLLTVRRRDETRTLRFGFSTRLTDLGP